MSRMENITPVPCRDWSNRILIVALAGILFLTLYPFEFSRHARMIVNTSPFLLGKGGKGTGGPLDVFLNILLFIPFGFALGAKFRSGGSSWKRALLWSWLAGALLSYTIEFVQIYIPARDSGWEDVFTNSMGAALGCVAAFVFSGRLFAGLTTLQARTQSWLSPRRAAVILVGYLCACFAISAVLERETRLDDWSTDCFLVIGNDAAGRHPWNGRVALFEAWDRALPKNVAEALIRTEAAAPDPLVRLDFLEVPPSQDKSLVPISFQVGPPQEPADPAAGGISRGRSTAPLSDVLNRVKSTNQFSVRIILEPAEIAGASGRIVSISEPSGLSDFYLRQDEGDLVFWFRNYISEQRNGPAWTVSKLLDPGRPRDILFSYDGSNVRLFADGKNVQTHSVGPGTALAGRIRHLKQGEVGGYRDIYYAAIFFPVGCLLGAVWANQLGRRFVFTAILATALLLAALFEFLLMRTSGAPFSWANFVLAASIVTAARLWTNADGATLWPRERSLLALHETVQRPA